MKYSDESYNLRIELDTKQCELSATEIDRLEGLLHPLRKPLEKFPVSALYLTIQFHERHNQYRVRAALQLSGRALATGDADEAWYPAVRRCVRKLVHNLVAYEHQLEDAEERSKHQKGTRHDVVSQREIDANAVEQSVRQGDYVSFRGRLYPYEESLRERVGRWIERYPAAQAELNGRLSLADVVEEVFLTAFERFDERPANVPFGSWLEGLIDPSVRLIVDSPEEQLSNIDFVRTWQEALHERAPEAAD